MKDVKERGENTQTEIESIKKEAEGTQSDLQVIKEANDAVIFSFFLPSPSLFPFLIIIQNLYICVN